MSNGQTILIAEDNELSLKMVQSLLQIAGYNTLVAENADTAIQLAEVNQPDLILMDMLMPIKSGYQACEELKSQANTQAIPIVAFTAMAMQEEQQKALNCGCIGVITKPIDVKQFAITIQQYLWQSQSKSSQKVDFIPVKNTAEPYYDEAAKAADCSDSEELVRIKKDFEQFIMHTSHDLQGPLRKAQQFMRFLDLPLEGDDERSVYVQGLHRSLKEMEYLLKSLTRMARIHLEDQEFTWFSLAEVVSETLATHHQEISEAQAHVQVDVFCELYGNPEQIRMVIEELLRNTLKFRSKERSLFIRITGRQADDDFYEVSLEDNGIGFEKHVATQIFEPYFRLNGMSKYPGNGLGLAMVKRIVERHMGSITAQSSPNQFTVIRFLLPVRAMFPAPSALIQR